MEPLIYKASRIIRGGYNSRKEGGTGKLMPFSSPKGGC